MKVLERKLIESGLSGGGHFVRVVEIEDPDTVPSEGTVILETPTETHTVVGDVPVYGWTMEAI